VETGGAVVACSLTTLSGYAALLLSVNGAGRSFGLAAGVCELSTQLTAMFVLPAALYSLTNFRAKRKEREREKARMSQINCRTVVVRRGHSARWGPVIMTGSR